MLVGVAAEIKTEEHRIAATPELIAELRARGHGVIVEAGAGLGSSIGDDEIAAAGAEIVESGPIVFERADLILKVKEPQVEEIAMLSEGQVLFTFSPPCRLSNTGRGPRPVRNDGYRLRDGPASLGRAPHADAHE